MTTKTLTYYNQNASNFISGTISVDFTENQDKFLKLFTSTPTILDFGCGSGRDTAYFLSKGCIVDATDGSEEFCRLATEYTGIQVKQLLFSELDENEKYDGIWACASILHLPKKELKDVLRKMLKATKKSGDIYISFKYGDFEGERNGRYFTDFTEDAFKEFIKDLDGIDIIETWITNDVRPERSGEKWLNIIIQKKAFVELGG